MKSPCGIEKDSCGRKDSSVAKSTVCSCSELGLGSQNLHGGSQLSVTPVPRDLTPLLTFSGMVIHMMHRQTYRKKNKNNNKKKLSSHEIKINQSCWVWWFTPLIPASMLDREAEASEFCESEANLDYISNSRTARVI